MDKKGKIVWTGNPMRGLDAVLAEVVAGKYDLAAPKQAVPAKAATDTAKGREKSPEKMAELFGPSLKLAERNQLAEAVAAIARVAALKKLKAAAVPAK